MKKILFFVLSVIFCLTAQAQENVTITDKGIVIDGKELIINSETDTTSTDLDIFKKTEFVYAFSIPNDSRKYGDWVYEYLTKEGTTILCYANLTLEICGNSVKLIDWDQERDYKRIDITQPEMDHFDEPLETFKYVFAFTPNKELHLVVYGK